jgi:integrase
MAEPISEKIVAELATPPLSDKGKPTNKLHYFSGAVLQGKKAPSGFAVRVTSAGTKSFVLFYRAEGKGKDGKVGRRNYLDTIGTWAGNSGGGKYTVLQGIVAARARADEINKPGSVADVRPARTRTLEDGKTPGGKTIAHLLDSFFAHHVMECAKLRTAPAIKSTFERLVKPAIGKLGIYDIKRSHVVDMLDTIAVGNGPVIADRTLAYVRKAFNWQVARDDDFMSPIAKGMARTNPTSRARTRILSDDEIRDLFAALDRVTKPACYARYIKFLFHTATRLNEAALMRWDEIDGDVWTIPAARYKTKLDHIVPLTSAALDLMGPRPRDVEAQPYVFPGNGGKGLRNHQQGWLALARHLAAVRNGKPMDRWTPHDLRRTARSLMRRIGINSDHAERCLGHVIGGVRKTYDRWDYFPEKKKAFEALAAQVDRILNPTDNVEDLAKRRKARG